MNKECIYINGNVLVEDENGRKKEMEYSDNIEEVLLQENLIEAMENESKKITEEKEKLGLKINTKTNYFFRITFILFSIISAIAVPQMFFKADLVNTIFGIFQLKDIATIFLVVIATIFNIGDIISEKIAKELIKKEYNAVLCELKYVNNQLLKEKEKLEKLNFVKEKNNIPEGFKISKITDKNLLEQIKKYLRIYYSIGYNSEKYKNYLEDGILAEKIKEEYREIETEEVLDYLQEGALLTRKRNDKNI